MNKKSLPYIFLGVLLLALLALRLYRRSSPPPKPRKEQVRRPEGPPADNPGRTTGFSRRVARLTFSRHARCRMDCRHIDESEVREILEKGTINYAKSDTINARSPRYALEGITHDGQQVRIVFAQDDEGTAVVTVIDLGRNWKCSCE